MEKRFAIMDFDVELLGTVNNERLFYLISVSDCIVLFTGGANPLVKR